MILRATETSIKEPEDLQEIRRRYDLLRPEHRQIPAAGGGPSSTARTVSRQQPRNHHEP
jgi:hypothetical protein